VQLSSEDEWRDRDIVVTILRSQIAVLRVVRSCASRENLTLQQFGVLRLLSLRRILPMNALSGELRVTPPVVTGIVDRLERRGMVKREESSNDRRTTEIVLTGNGKRVYRKIQTNYRWSIQESLGRSLTPAEQKILASLLRRFAREIHVKSDA